MWSCLRSYQVYGEFSSCMISSIVKEVPISSSHSFIDLGSGTQLRRCLHTCRCGPGCATSGSGGAVCLKLWSGETNYSRRVRQGRCELACLTRKDMSKNFTHYMEWFGKEHGEVFFCFQACTLVAVWLMLVSNRARGLFRR